MIMGMIMRVLVLSALFVVMSVLAGLSLRLGWCVVRLVL
jgi:hypothetical protein